MKILSALLAVVLAVGLTLGLTGCNQSTTAELISIVGNSVSSVLSIEGNSTLAKQLSTDFDAASVAVSNWKEGTPAQDVVQALNLVQKDLSLIPVSDQTKVFIDLAISTTDSIIAVVNPIASGNMSVAYVKATRVISPKQYKRQWNALVDVHPKYNAAHLK